MIRLNKYLANQGFLARRKVDLFVAAGRISVNGQRATLGQQIDLSKDRITIDGKPYNPISNSLIYLLLYKPIGYITTTQDQFNRPSVLDLIPKEYKVYPVGRLDYQTAGLLLLTNDGEFTNKLTSPRFKLPKTYRLLLASPATPIQLRYLREGIELEDGYKTQPAKVHQVKPDVVDLTIYEGKNRQIRRMCDAISLTLLELSRLSVGKLDLGNLKPGQWRLLSKKDLDLVLATK